MHFKVTVVTDSIEILFYKMTYSHMIKFPVDATNKDHRSRKQAAVCCTNTNAVLILFNHEQYSP